VVANCDHRHLLLIRFFEKYTRLVGKIYREKPLRQIVANAGLEGSVVVQRVKEDKEPKMPMGGGGMHDGMY
jgi:hypothetical protein